ncbi:BZ3501_MvSof-1269-A2-R1_Chr12-3g03616 [Microbotryum saponariae]|nr:BZ3501_MvSof-1269-A2-R1_Chr12-3g03616 [Microbotryum saponariae]
MMNGFYKKKNPDPLVLTWTLYAQAHGPYTDQKERSEVESVTGSLGYVAYILPALRTHLNCLYRQCIAHGDRKAVSRARRLDRRTYDQLEYWRRSLSSEGPFSTLFEALPIPSKLALASDACMHGLGIVINGYSAYFALPEGWTDLPPPRHSVSITNAEAWAHLVLQCDNTGVVLGWRKGHSMNPLLNSSFANLRSLEETRGVKWLVEYINTKVNPADVVSRQPGRPRQYEPFPSTHGSHIRLSRWSLNAFDRYWRQHKKIAIQVLSKASKLALDSINHLPHPNTTKQTERYTRKVAIPFPRSRTPLASDRDIGGEKRALARHLPP